MRGVGRRAGRCRVPCGSEAPLEPVTGVLGARGAGAAHVVASIHLSSVGEEVTAHSLVLGEHGGDVERRLVVLRRGDGKHGGGLGQRVAGGRETRGMSLGTHGNDGKEKVPTSDRAARQWQRH